MFKKKSDKIQFISTVEGLDKIEECLPKPAKNFIPQWFKDIPTSVGENVTAKHCPSFPDFFSQGYIIPMWSDTILKYDKESNYFSVVTGSEAFLWETHSNDQFIDYTNSSFIGSKANFVFKPICPWRIVTPPGWSVLELPLFYHFNEGWSILPGVIDTDIYTQINQQVLYHGNGKEVKIKRGEPFSLYIPFKRSNQLKHEIKKYTIEQQKNFNKENAFFNTKLMPNGLYRKKQRERNKNV